MKITTSAQTPDELRDQLIAWVDGLIKQEQAHQVRAHLARDSRTHATKQAAYKNVKDFLTELEIES